MQPDQLPPAVAEQIERWLVERLGASSKIPGAAADAPSLTASELLEIVRNVLVRRPALGPTAVRLSTYDQFRVTLELANAFVVVRADHRLHLVPEQVEVIAAYWPATCRAAHFRRRRRRR